MHTDVTKRLHIDENQNEHGSYWAVQAPLAGKAGRCRARCRLSTQWRSRSFHSAFCSDRVGSLGLGLLKTGCWPHFRGIDLRQR